MSCGGTNLKMASLGCWVCTTTLDRLLTIAPNGAIFVSYAFCKDGTAGEGFNKGVKRGKHEEHIS